LAALYVLALETVHGDGAQRREPVPVDVVSGAAAEQVQRNA
jgi:hypothetical protein